MYLINNLKVYFKREFINKLSLEQIIKVNMICYNLFMN